MIVSLFDLPPIAERANSFLVRPVFAAEASDVASWVEAEFGAGWARELERAAGHDPCAAYIAVRDGEVIGFACFDAAAKGVFGPTGVAKTARREGVGKALLIRALTDMRAVGYAYAIIGGVGPVEYYEEAVGAQVIKSGSASFLTSIYRP